MLTETVVEGDAWCSVSVPEDRDGCADEPADLSAHKPNIVVIGEPDERPGSVESRGPAEWWAGAKHFVGAWGLSPVRELAWVMGLIERDAPALWELA